MKERGILLPVFSLPSKYGIGDFGNEAYEFVDILSENNIKYWEILPISACNGLPYSPISYYALNEAYISVDKLIEDGLIKYAEPMERSDRVIYEHQYKVKYYKEAYCNFERNYQYELFSQNREILKYADFMSKRREESRDYYVFLQYIVIMQWIKLKKYANSKNVEIIGDMPIYPIFDSVETKYHPDCFEMENARFTFEAGTPPDYFNSEGQKWNSPVYNVENIKRDNYNYLIDRFRYYLTFFDKVRVDYFRGYDSFFKIPYGGTGKDGFYADGVGAEFFDKLFKEKEINKESLLVEDLGDIRRETVELREKYGFTRQKILQFSLDLDNIYDRDNTDENVIMFPGNHDCPTIYGWYKTLDDTHKENLKEFLRRNECNDQNINLGILQYCMKCKAKMVIVTAQDILGLDDKARINVPGTYSQTNWSWEMKDFEDFKERLKDFK